MMTEAFKQKMKDGYSLFVNPRMAKTGSPANAWLAAAACDSARQEIASWPGYAPTPLINLSGLAKAKGLANIWYKDESKRFGLASFKALGGAYAVFRLLQAKIAEKTGISPTSAELRSGAQKQISQTITVTTATDGNHGRSVAWAAKMFHCRCVVYVPRTCSQYRESAIASYGAEVIRTTLDYDATVRQCAEDAEHHGRLVVSDTSWDSYELIPALVMQGYSVMPGEVVEQLGSAGPPTHVFVQAGVGGLAATVCAYLSRIWSAKRPKMIVVEPSGAACLFVSAVAGKLTATPEIRTIMAGLECGEPSRVAWEILAHGTDCFMTVPDSSVPDCMRLLAKSPYGDPSIVAGESAVAGLAALFFALDDAEARSTIGLNPESKILLFGTEGATDPDLYRKLISPAR